MEEKAIVLEGVGRSYTNGRAPVIALSGIHLGVDYGQRVAIVGPSGSGKTTLLNLIGALDRPDRGTVRCLGMDIASMSEKAAAAFRRKHIGLVFQDDALMPELTVAENIELPLALLRDGPTARARKVADLLAALGLSSVSGAFPMTLSGGEKQRVAVARAVAHEPELLLADEPTANLDAASAARVLDLIDRISAQKGLTVLLSTHDPRVFERFAVIARLEDGRLS